MVRRTCSKLISCGCGIHNGLSHLYFSYGEKDEKIVDCNSSVIRCFW